MSTFANKMAEAKRAKAEARARGEQAGDYRGTVRPRPLEELPLDWLEAAFARIAINLAYRVVEEKQQLDWYTLCNADPTIADAGMRQIPW
jgi:hypothetical protein